MQSLFSTDLWLLWATLLALLLFLPVRRLIWMLSVNRAARRHREIDEVLKRRLKKRASLTAALACYVFAVLYTYTLLHNSP